MTRALDRLAPLSTTGVGSLPFVDARVGVRHAVRAYDVPFCPQLPALDGDMVREWLGADPGRCGWSADRDRERPAAWNAFLEALRGPAVGRDASARIVKLQVTGPLTLAVALERAAEGRGGVRDAPGLARELATWLAANAAAQVGTLREAGHDVLLVVDEPGLAYATASAPPAVWDPLRRTGAAGWGLHVCGPVPWALVRAAEPDVLSFDVARYGLDGTARATLDALLTAGTRIAWGVLDPVDPATADVVAGRLAACLSAVAGRRSLDDVAARSLLTPSCGTGRLSGTREHLVAAILQAAGRATASALAAAPAGTPTVEQG